MLSLFENLNGVLPKEGSLVGLVAGMGRLPELMAEAARRRGFKLVVASLGREHEDPIRDSAEAYEVFTIQDAAKIMRFMKGHDVRYLLLSGRMPKVGFYHDQYKPDSIIKGIFNKTRVQGDDTLLRAAMKVIEFNGFKILSPSRILKDYLTPKGAITANAPTDKQLEDIRYGYEIAGQIGRMDIGQMVVVKNGLVVAVEAIEGTNETIRRVQEMGLRDTVIVKRSKPNQTLKLDMPTIGPKTVLAARNAACAVLAAESGKSLFIGRDEAIPIAEEAGMRLYGI